MLKRLIPLTALAMVAAFVLALNAGADSRRDGGPRTVSGERCAKNGVRFLLKNDLLRAAAQGKVDYDTIDSTRAGAKV
jgi:hypothetical protein